MRWATIVFAALLLVLGSSRESLAIEATPTPVECAAEPLTIEQIEDLASASADPPVAFDDEHAPTLDQLTLIAIQATVSAAVECANDNDPFRSLAYFTDRYIAERFGPDHPDDLASLAAAESRPPVRADDADLLTVAEFEDGEIDSENGVARITITLANASTSWTDQLYLVNTGDRWLIDSWEPISSSPATPVVAG